MHTAAFQVGLISQASVSTAMLSLTPSWRITKELGPAPSEPSLSRYAAVLYDVLPPLSLAHLALFAIGGKYTGLALTNFTRSKALLVLTPKLLNIRFEIAPVLRVALSS